MFEIWTDCPNLGHTALVKFIDRGLLDVFILVFEKYVPTKLIIYNKKIFKLYRKKRRRKKAIDFLYLD